MNVESTLKNNVVNNYKKERELCTIYLYICLVSDLQSFFLFVSQQNNFRVSYHVHHQIGNHRGLLVYTLSTHLPHLAFAGK